MIPNLSVIIVSYNTREITLACLRSVYDRTCDIESEVIVVDNASADGSAQAIAALYPQVKLIINKKNRGFAAANNQGLNIARGKYTLLLNSDTVVLDGALDKLLAFAESRPKAGVIGGRTVRPDGTLALNCFEPAGLFNLLISACALHRLYPRSRTWGRARLTYWDYATPRRVPVVAGCFMLVRRAAMTDVGLLDERFFMYAEEMDWCVRFSTAGWEVWYTPDSSIIHYGGMSAAQSPTQMSRTAQSSLILFLKKYHKGPYVTLCRAVLLSGLILRMPMRLARALLYGRDRLGSEIRQQYAIASLYVGLQRP